MDSVQNCFLFSSFKSLGSDFPQYSSYLKRGEDELQTAMIAHDIEFDNFPFAYKKFLRNSSICPCVVEVSLGDSVYQFS